MIPQRSRLLRVRGTHDVAIRLDGALAFEHLNHDRPRGHVAHEIRIERTRLVHGIESFGLILTQPQHFCRDDLEPPLLEAAVHLTDQILRHTIGFDDG